MTTTVISTSVSESRSVPRIWLEGQRLASAGVMIGVQYALNVSKQLRRIELRPAPDGFVGKTFSVSKRTRNDRVSPLIEVRDAVVAELFSVGTKLRVSIHAGRIVISISNIAQRVEERISRFLNKLKSGESLHVVSLFHGGGVLDRAIHEGFERQKLSSYVKVAVEIDGDYLDSSLRNNSMLFRDDSTVINSDIRDVNLMGSGIPQADVLTGGVPCTGASKSGAAKNKLSCAEEHETAGTLFFDFLEWIKIFNPCIVLLENVVEYMKSVGMTVIRAKLESLGYELSETVLDGHAHGSLERRQRLCMVATTPGVCSPIDFDQIEPIKHKEAKISDILEDIPETSEMWRRYDYLAEKQDRDIAAGKGFKRQLLTGDEDGCGTIGRGYAKARSTEPFIISPWDPLLSRLFTDKEHARVKTIPVDLIEGLSVTKAHEVLGQSVIFCAFVAVGDLIARTVKGLVNKVVTVISKVSDQSSVVNENPKQEAQKIIASLETYPLFSLSA